MSSSSSLQGSEVNDLSKQAEMALNRQIKALKLLHKKLEAHRNVVVGRKTTAKLGNISPEIYGRGSITTQTDIISRLPYEIQEMVWQKLHSDGDRICLALTCKFNAGMLDQLKRKLPAFRMNYPTRGHKLVVLMRLNKWSGLKGYNLCCQCVTYVQGGKQGWGGDSGVFQSKISMKGAMLSGPRCDHCVLRDQLERVKHKEAYNEYVKLVKKYRPFEGP